VNEGAARVSAIEKKRFEVVNFADKKKIEQKNYDALLVFPIVVSTKIIDEKMKE
jgi:hypothetical protein